jgi:DNA replication protein DnaC
MSHDPLPLLLRSLRLPTMAEAYAPAIAAAEAENWGYRRFLTHLAEAETSDRTTRRIQRMLDDSGLPSGKTLASLDLNKWPEKVRRQLPTLLDADFVRRGDTVCAFGLPGRGKSTFVAALAREWIQRHQLRVLFTPTFKLVGQLLAAKRDLKLNAALAKLQRYDALCLDELGYTQQSSEEGDILFQLLAERYETKTVVITSNLVFSQWDKIFHNPMTAMAAADRLVHHGVVLEFSNESLRTPSGPRLTKAT